jgi:hypothetical protein
MDSRGSTSPNQRDGKASGMVNQGVSRRGKQIGAAIAFGETPKIYGLQLEPTKL